MKIPVIGIGNESCGGDGGGIHSVQKLRHELEIRRTVELDLNPILILDAVVLYLAAKDY